MQVCFGLDHPYYLQTLALWTFLQEKRDKTDAELLSLMNFHYNRPVDISSVLTQVRSTHTQAKHARTWLQKNLIVPELNQRVEEHMAKGETEAARALIESRPQ